jgi:hypothetical protein
MEAWQSGAEMKFWKWAWQAEGVRWAWQAEGVRWACRLSQEFNLRRFDGRFSLFLFIHNLQIAIKPSKFDLDHATLKSFGRQI